jgi:hypothetical protein
MASIRINVIPAKPEQARARQIKFFLEDPFYQQSRIPAGNGVYTSIPEGSIKGYLEKHLDELGGPDSYVQLFITPISADGTEGMPLLLSSPQELAELLKKGQVRFNFDISAEQMAELEKGIFPQSFVPTTNQPEISCPIQSNQNTNPTS